MNPLDLNRPRDLSAIVSTAFSTWWHNLGVFIALAAIPVFPAIFLVDGVWGRQLSDPDNVELASAITSGFLQTILIAPLVTAMHVLVVMGLARSQPLILQCVEAGVAGYVLRDSPLSDVFASVRAASAAPPPRHARLASRPESRRGR